MLDQKWRYLMNIIKGCVLFSVFFNIGTAVAGPTYSTGKITSLLASGTNPAIRLSGNISPNNQGGITLSR